MKEKQYELYYNHLEVVDKALEKITYKRDKKLKKLNRKVAKKTRKLMAKLGLYIPESVKKTKEQK